MSQPSAAIAVLGCALLLSACGTAGKPNQPSASGVSSGIKFATCMRSHGVPNFPDPGSGGGIQISNGINPSSPAFRGARNACAGLLPGGGRGRGHVSEARKLQMLQLAECMRAHGITDFPDPTSSPPSAPPSGGGVAFGVDGAFISVSQTMMQSPEFKTAAGECSFPGIGGKGGPKPAAAG